MLDNQKLNDKILLRQGEESDAIEKDTDAIKAASTAAGDDWRDAPLSERVCRKYGGPDCPTGGNNQVDPAGNDPAGDPGTSAATGQH
jgi:hypothetical protein